MNDVTAFVFCTIEDHKLGKYVLSIVNKQCHSELMFDNTKKGIIPMQNLALKRCKTKYAWFVHADVIPNHDTLKKLYDFMKETGCKIVEAELIHPDGVLLHGHTKPDFTEENLNKCNQFPNSLHTACILIETGLPIEYFPPDKWKFGSDDTWMSQSILKAGYFLGHCPEARCLHLGSYATRKQSFNNKLVIKWLYDKNKRMLKDKFKTPLENIRSNNGYDDYRMSKYRRNV